MSDAKEAVGDKNVLVDAAGTAQLARTTGGERWTERSPLSLHADQLAGQRHVACSVLRGHAD